MFQTLHETYCKVSMNGNALFDFIPSLDKFVFCSLLIFDNKKLFKKPSSFAS